MSKIPSAKDIIGFRNVLSHGYDVVSDEMVYDIVEYDLPIFYKTIKRL
ncbi:HepT-like ribonuclease domain-containing protein [Chlorobaculum tepidum]